MAYAQSSVVSSPEFVHLANYYSWSTVWIQIANSEVLKLADQNHAKEMPDFNIYYGFDFSLREASLPEFLVATNAFYQITNDLNHLVQLNNGIPSKEKFKPETVKDLSRIVIGMSMAIEALRRISIDKQAELGSIQTFLLGTFGKHLGIGINNDPSFVIPTLYYLKGKLLGFTPALAYDWASLFEQTAYQSFPGMSKQRDSLLIAASNAFAFTLKVPPSNETAFGMTNDFAYLASLGQGYYLAKAYNIDSLIHHFSQARLKRALESGNRTELRIARSDLLDITLKSRSSELSFFDRLSLQTRKLVWNWGGWLLLGFTITMTTLLAYIVLALSDFKLLRFHMGTKALFNKLLGHGDQKFSRLERLFVFLAPFLIVQLFTYFINLSQPIIDSFLMR